MFNLIIIANHLQIGKKKKRKAINAAQKNSQNEL